MNDVDKQINDIFVFTDDVSNDEKQHILREYIGNVIKRRRYYHNKVLLFSGEYITIKICCKLLIKGENPHYTPEKLEDIFDKMIG